MARNNGGSTRESTSFSMRSSTIECLERFCEVMDIDNKSQFVDEAIRERIGREIVNNPLAYRKVCQLLSELS